MVDSSKALAYLAEGKAVVAEVLADHVAGVGYVSAPVSLDEVDPLQTQRPDATLGPLHGYLLVVVLVYPCPYVQPQALGYSFSFHCLAHTAIR